MSTNPLRGSPICCNESHAFRALASPSAGWTPRLSPSPDKIRHARPPATLADIRAAKSPNSVADIKGCIALLGRGLEREPECGSEGLGEARFLLEAEELLIGFRELVAARFWVNHQEI